MFGLLRGGVASWGRLGWSTGCGRALLVPNAIPGRQLGGLRATGVTSMPGEESPVEGGFVEEEEPAEDPMDPMEAVDLYPRQVVAELDRDIVGQQHAKRAVAISLRNRWRRRKVPKPLQDEIVPKNILMIGPTGVGKTEIARRLAKLCKAPFIKVEATKFTEVGFHGRDVDQIIRDLVEVSIMQTKENLRTMNKEIIDAAVEERLLDILTGTEKGNATNKRAFRDLLRKGLLEMRKVEFTPAVRPSVGTHGKGNLSELSNLLRMGMGSDRQRRMTVKEARVVLQEEEVEKQFDTAIITRKAIESVESSGIVFIDEIDKIVVPSHRTSSADGSSEGVQRDLLPVIEGSTIHTKYGNVETGKILFIASGAFHSVKPSDMMAELQGRLPIRVELQGLTEQDLYRVLCEPESNLIRQQVELMKTEGIDLRFEEEAIRQIAAVAAEINESVENIGARRLMTVIERIVEDISFNCDSQDDVVVIDKAYVQERVADLQKQIDLNRFIL